MISERMGKFFFLKTRPFFFFLLLVSPLLGSSAFLFLKYTELTELEDRFAAASLKEKQALQRKAQQEQFLLRYTQADPYFLDQKIESLSFLNQEREQLEAMLKNGATPNQRILQERLFFLTGEENRLRFSEEAIRSSAVVKEIDEKQRHPIQIDERDLSQLLALIEDVEIEEAEPAEKSPQLLIRDFRLKKQTTPLHTEVFEVEMGLLKREFIKK